MKKAAKAAKKAHGKSEPTKVSSDHLRQKAAEHRAQARLHEARADMMDVKDPPKAKKQGLISGGY